jgi:NAD binding domain of 6-phosphogluconate dehydrogenase
MKIFIMIMSLSSPIIKRCSSYSVTSIFRIVVIFVGIYSCCVWTITSAHQSQQQSFTNHVTLNDFSKYNDITILGLGSMGQAFVKCLLQQKNQQNDNNNTTTTTAMNVHGWNRGIEKRDIVRDMGATIYETPDAAIMASNITLILIDDWDGIIQLITKDINRTVFTNKVLVLFSTYTPTDIIKLQTEYFPNDDNTNVVLVGGAIVGVPQTICTPKALLLLSTDIPQLQNVGRIEIFHGNVGYAALVNIALILVITFGIAGQELAHLIIQQYGVMTNDLLQRYISLSSEMGPDYTKMLLPISSNSIITKEYEKSYVPVGVFRNVLQMHLTFMKEIGIADDTFVSSYVQYLNKVSNVKFGPAAWIEEAIVSNDSTNMKSINQEL